MVRMPLSLKGDLISPADIADSARLRGAIVDLLNDIGENPSREGLAKTPDRFLKAMRELTVGYALSAEDAVGEGIFEAEGPGLVCVKGIEFFSLCEHHLLPFWGEASVAYLPNEKILGLSKLARIVEVFARRLQVQERLTHEIAQAVNELIRPRAVFVKVGASHMCMMMRGVRKVQSTTSTEFGIGLDSLPQTDRERMFASCDGAYAG